MSDYFLEVQNLVKQYSFKSHKKTKIRVVDNVSFTLNKGEVLGIVGESGSGKTTLGKLILNLVRPTSGKVLFKGKNIFDLSKKELRFIRPKMQPIFQDPYSSLNPRHTVGKIIREATLKNKNVERKYVQKHVEEIMQTCGIKKSSINNYPHEFSGGQRQRISIARALALNPELIIADEPVSALDISIQSQIINVLNDLKYKLSLTYILISHDLLFVKYLSDKIGIMYLGNLVEMADKNTIFKNPVHPYTKFLLNSIPISDPTLRENKTILRNSVTDEYRLMNNCTFSLRCPYALDICRKVSPSYKKIANNHMVACHLYS